MPESGGGLRAPHHDGRCVFWGVKRSQPAQPLHVARSGFGEYHFSQGEEESWKLTTPQILRAPTSSPSHALGVPGPRCAARPVGTLSGLRAGLHAGAPARAGGSFVLGHPRAPAPSSRAPSADPGRWLLQFFVWRAQGAASPRERVGWSGWARTVFPGPPVSGAGRTQGFRAVGCGLGCRRHASARPGPPRARPAQVQSLAPRTRAQSAAPGRSETHGLGEPSA